jgi:hypothetical protein
MTACKGHSQTVKYVKGSASDLSGQGTKVGQWGLLTSCQAQREVERKKYSRQEAITKCQAQRRVKLRTYISSAMTSHGGLISMHHSCARYVCPAMGEIRKVAASEAMGKVDA